jgi:hypothetical protein
MFDNFRDKLRRLKKDDSKKRPGKEFSLRARTEEMKNLLGDAALVAAHIIHMGRDFQQEGFSTGGFTAEIATSNGLKDGPPKIDPVTVFVDDKAGGRLFTIEFFATDTGNGFRVKGATPAIQEKLDALPEGKAPHEQVESVMSALTPADEIGASIACVKQGRLVFGAGALAAIVADKETAAKNIAAEETAAREREAVQGATVLQAPTTVGAPLKLKPQKG